MSEQKPQKNLIPEHVLNTLSEFSPAGFILYVVNEKEQPEVYSFFDSDMSALGLRRFAFINERAVQEIQESATLDGESPTNEED